MNLNYCTFIVIFIFLILQFIEHIVANKKTKLPEQMGLLFLHLQMVIYAVCLCVSMHACNKPFSNIPETN